MRRMVVLPILAALALLPSALAMQPLEVKAPDVSVGVVGVHQVVDTTGYTPGAPGVVAQAQTKDTSARVNGAACTLDANDHRATKERAEETCSPATVTTDATPEELVTAKVDVILPAATQAAGPKAAPLHAEAATVAPVQVSSSLMIAAAAAGISLAALYGVWRLLKLTGLVALIPLYSHLSDDQILDDPNRASIYRLIQSEPGISTKDVADRLDLAWGTVTHHLGKLEKRRFVVSKKYGKYRRYFANGEGGTDRKDALAVLRLDRTGDVAALIRAQPGVTQKAVSEALGVSSSTILWHVKRLEEVQLVTKVREGKLVRYYPAEGLSGLDIIPAVPIAHAA